MQNTELRPLGAGEILDRAVTLFVRRFVPLVVVLAAAIVPVLILEAVIAPGSTRLIGDMGALITASGRAQSTSAIETLTKDQGGAAQYFFVIAISYATRILMWSAILAVASSAYAGASTSLGAAYRVGVRKWFPQAVVAIAFFIVAMLCAVPFFIAYLIAIAGVVALSALHATVVAVIFGVIAGLVMFGWIALAGSWVFMTYQVASAALVIEDAGPVAAITAGVRRTLSRQTFWRTVLGGMILFAVTQGAVVLFAVVGIALSSLTHIPALSFAILGGGQIVVDGLLAVFVVVFVTDLRVRREGLDLVALSSLPG